MSWLLYDRSRPYVPAVGTDVMQTWKRFGFIPPSSLKPDDVERAKNDLMLMIETIKGTDKMTYKDLLQKLQSLTETELNCDVTVYDSSSDDFYSAYFLINRESDVLDTGHPFLEI